MQAVEIVLIVVGVLCICISFFVSKKKSDAADAGEVPRGAEIWTEKDEEVIIKHIDEILEKRGMELVETTEDQMNRICNEKIMAIDEFTKPLLEKINVNHEEVVFMYNMLNEKQKELKETIMEDTVRRSVPVIEPVQAEPEPADPVEPVRMSDVYAAPEPARTTDAYTVSGPVRNDDTYTTVPGAVTEEYSSYESARTVETFTAPIDIPEEEPVIYADMSAGPDPVRASSASAPEPVGTPVAPAPARKYADAIISATEANRSAATGLQRLGAAPPEPIPEIAPPTPKIPKPAQVESKKAVAAVPEPEPVVKYAEEPSHIEKNGGIEDRVHALYRAGKSVVDISKELNIGQGEVKLMIAMYKKRH